MLGTSGWRTSGELHIPYCSGSVDMDNLKATRNVWGPEEAFLSPPEHSGTLSASLESEESSEDCEDYISGLAEELAKSMLQEEEVAAEEASKRDFWGIASAKPAWSSHKTVSSPTSPQSTLAGIGGFNWEARSHKDSLVPCPPSPIEGEPMHMLYGELLRVKLEDQLNLASQNPMLSLQKQVIQRPSLLPPNRQRPLSPSYNSHRDASSHASGRRFNQHESHGHKDNVLSAAIDRAIMAKQGRQPRSKGGSPEVGGGKQVAAGWGGGRLAGVGACQGRRGGGVGVGGGGGSSAKRREEQQQQHFSLFASNMGGGGKGGEGGAMRAVFLGAPASRECGGTGVFLPRRLGSTHHQDSKRKPACSTVLLPSHIVQALNLNVEDTLPSRHRRDTIPSNHRFRHYSQFESGRVERKEELSSSYFPVTLTASLQEVAPNISLPSEWTY